MKAIIYLASVSAVSSLTSCTSSLAPASPAPVMAGSYNEEASVKSRVLIKTGSISLEVHDVKETTTKVQNMVKKRKGYVENINSREKGGGYASLTVRVPKEGLATTMNDLTAMGKVTSRNIDVEDVTDEWIDLQAKVKNLRTLRDRLRRLLDKANNVKDVLAVEKELNRVQSELDSLEGKIKAMQQNVSYSKINVSIRHKSIPGPLGVVTKGTWWGVKKLFVIRD